MLAALAGLALLGVGVLARSLQRQWLAPAPFLALYWALATSLPILAFGAGAVSSRTVMFVVAGVAVFAFGSMIGSARVHDAPVREIRSNAVRADVRERPIRALLYIGFLCCILAAVLNVRAHGFNLRESLTSFENLLNLSNQLSVARYGDVTADSRVASALLGLNYAAALASHFLPRSRHRAALLGLPILGVLAYAMVTTQHMPLVVTSAMSAGSYCCSAIHRTGRPPELTARRVAATTAVGLIFASAFIVISFMRVGTFSAEYRPVILDNARVYALGYMPAFDQWLDGHLAGSDHELQLGNASTPFVGVLLGKDRAETRAYDETVVVGAGKTTNIYTWWRNFLVDFGYGGSAAVIAALGLLSGRLYRASSTSAAAAGGLAAVYSVLLLSSVFTITTFTNVVLGFVIAVAVLRMAGKPAEVRGRDRRPGGRPFSGAAR